jgi:ABC-type multidrug transport system fused ATPase/permease subunit
MAKFSWLCPQNIYLADKSIAENIAFGVPKTD